MFCKRACCESHSGMNMEEEVMDLSEDESEQLGGVSGCVPASVPIGTGSLSQVNVFCDVVVSDSDCESVKPQTFSLSRKCKASVALGVRQRCILLDRPSKLCQRLSGGGDPRRKSTLCTAMPECMQSRAPPQLTDTPWHAHQRNHQRSRWRWTWKMSIPPWTARDSMVETSWRQVKSIQVEVSELEHLILSPEDADISIRSLAMRVMKEVTASLWY